MNLENETSRTSQNEDNLKSSSSDASLSSTEEPLIGLLQKPLSQMTENELREFVSEQSILRNSPVTLRAKMSTKDEKTEKINLFDSF